MMHLTATCILLCHFQFLLFYIDVWFDIKYHKIVGCKVNDINIKQVRHYKKHLLPHHVLWYAKEVHSALMIVLLTFGYASKQTSTNVSFFSSQMLITSQPPVKLLFLMHHIKITLKQMHSLSKLKCPHWRHEFSSRIYSPLFHQKRFSEIRLHFTFCLSTKCRKMLKAFFSASLGLT